MPIDILANETALLANVVPLLPIKNMTRQPTRDVHPTVRGERVLGLVSGDGRLSKDALDRVLRAIT